MDNGEKPQRPIRIFLSHKTIDRPHALEIKRILEDLGGGPEQLRVFVAERDIEFGKDWRDQIREELLRANLLMLLFTQPTLDWDWCLYEVGLYTKLEVREPKPIVCLTAGPPPAPLSHLQAISRTNRAGLEKLVRVMLEEAVLYAEGTGEGATNPTEPLRSGLEQETVKRVADRIADSLQNARSTYYPCHRLVVTPPEGGQILDGSTIADGALVEDPDEGTLVSVFALDRGSPTDQWTWGDLVERVRRADDPGSWEKELGKRLALAIEGDKFEPITATFRGVKTGIYRPEIYSVEHVDGQPVQVTIVLDSVSAPDEVGDKLFQLLRADLRFRGEIFDPYLGKLAQHVDQMGADIVWARLADSFEIIVGEATANELFDPAQLEHAYGDTSDTVRDLGSSWEAKLSALRSAIAERSVRDAEVALAAMSLINHDFTAITAERVARQASLRAGAARSAVGH